MNKKSGELSHELFVLYSGKKKKKLVIFSPCSETLSEAELRRIELIYLAEENNGIKAVSRLLLITLIQVYLGQAQVQQKI